jgi:hypothetical protein
MVRRLKTDPTFAKKWDGTPRFPPRVLEPIEVPYTDEEREIHAALRRYTKLRSDRATDNTERFATEFVLKTLKRRLFSSPAAFLTTLERHEESLRSARKKAVSKPSMGVLQREFDRMDEEYADDFEYDEATADALDSATRLFVEPTEQEIALLKQMKKWAERARAQQDSKTKQLVQWLKDNIKPGGKWPDERRLSSHGPRVVFPSKSASYNVSPSGRASRIITPCQVGISSSRCHTSATKRM